MHSKSLVDSSGGLVKFLMHKWEKVNNQPLVPPKLNEFFGIQQNYGTLFLSSLDSQSFTLRKHFYLEGK